MAIRNPTALALATGLLVSPAIVRGEPVVRALTGATLIDGTGAAPRQATVLIRGERIAAVLSPGAELPAGAEVLDLPGRTLIPGLVDAYAELADGPGGNEPARAGGSLAALLAAGITTARVFDADSAAIAALADAVSAGALAGPRLAVAGRIIDADASWSEHELRAALRLQAAAGAGFAMLGPGTPPGLLRAAIAESRRLGLRVAGRLQRTPWTAAARERIHELAGPASWSDFYLEPRHRERFRASLARHGAARARVEWLETADPRSPELARLIRWLKRRRVWVAPQLAAAADQLAGEGRAGRAVWPKLLALVRSYHAGGVRLIAGSGGDIHDELARLAAAGIAPREVIRIATRNGAEALGLGDRAGTVAPGRSADLVVLRASPLAEIANTRRIEVVFARGREHRPPAPGSTVRADRECPTPSP